MTAQLRRETFRTSRLLDFASEKELVAQTGHRPAQWPLVVLKELVDNALDACEEAGIAPKIDITVDKTGITVADDGPGIPAETVKGVLDFAVRVSSREAYVSPTRGAQGNALKTIVAIPFVLDGEKGQIEIEACGIHHVVKFEVDRVRQEPFIRHDQGRSELKSGTVVRVPWRDLSNADPAFDDDEDAEDSPFNRRHEVPIFTIRHRLRLAEPQLNARGHMVRRENRDRGDRPDLEQMEAV
jgi:DNA topoisomerase VI subunit B